MLALKSFSFTRKFNIYQNKLSVSSWMLNTADYRIRPESLSLVEKSYEKVDIP